MRAIPLVAACALLSIAASADAGPLSDVTIVGSRFAPPLGLAFPGETVRVANLDPVAHTLTAEDGSFDTGRLRGGASGTFPAPAQPGAYAYHCLFHPAMRGELRVVEAE